jgi:maltooligosyltrehalose synthase
MDILRNLFGSVTSGIIRLAVTAGVLLLAYLFIVKPVLKTTSDAIENSGINEISKTFDDVNLQVQRQIRRSLKTTEPGGGKRQRLIRCIKRADQDVDRIQRCTRKF